MDFLTVLWRVAGFLGASIVVILLAFVLYCVIKTIVENARKGGGGNGR